MYLLVRWLVRVRRLAANESIASSWTFSFWDAYGHQELRLRRARERLQLRRTLCIRMRLPLVGANWRNRALHDSSGFRRGCRGRSRLG